MDDSTRTMSSGTATAIAAPGRAGQASRAVEVLLSAQRAELNKLEQRITEQIQRLAQELARDDNAAPSAARDEASSEQLTFEQARLEQLRHEFDEARAEHRRSEEQLAAARDELAHEQSRIARQREQLERERGELEQQRLQLAERITETKCQRRRIAKALEAQRAAQQSAISRRQAEMQRLQSADHVEIHEQLAAATEEAETLRKQTAQMRRLLNARADELNLLRDQVRDLTAQIERLEFQHDKLSQELAVNDSLSHGPREQINQLRSERDDLLREVEGYRARGGNGEETAELQQKYDDLQRRFEMALEDLREVKRRNSDLETQVASGPISSPNKVVSAGRLDWESQKRQLLASLEADPEPASAEQQQQRLTIEGTIRITDEVVAGKDREIAELRAQLAAASHHASSGERGATADLINADEVIRQEREKLARLETEWREKLRKAEIDISVERAKIARDRAEIEEKLQSYQAQARQASNASSDADGSSAERPTRRWLSRLGLKDLDE